MEMDLMGAKTRAEMPPLGRERPIIEIKQELDVFLESESHMHPGGACSSERLNDEEQSDECCELKASSVKIKKEPMSEAEECGLGLGDPESRERQGDDKQSEAGDEGWEKVEIKIEQELVKEETSVETFGKDEQSPSCCESQRNNTAPNRRRQLYQCHICSAEYGNVIQLTSHAKTHHRSKDHSSKVIMDDYKHAVIEKVRQMPLLWDPEHVDYKNKDQRQQAWDKLESDTQPPNKGVTVKQTWEGLNRAFNSAMSRRKKKTSGSGQGNDKPWKFETSMSFVKAVKEKRNTTSNLEEIDDFEGDKNSSRGLLEQATDESGIYDADDDHEDNLVPSTSFKPIPPRPSSKSTASKRKATDDAHDDARAGLYKVMTQRMEEKQKSPRLKFFESIMPQVDEMTDDCFLDFQIEVLSSLKRFRQHDPHPEPLNDYCCPMTPATWSTSTSSQTSTPSPAPPTPYPMQAGFLPPTRPSHQSYYQFPN